MRRIWIGMLAAGLAAACLLPAGADAAALRVLSSGGFTPAYRALAPGCEARVGERLELVLGASMGETPTAIPNRLRRGEPADVLLMVGPALDGLLADGLAVAGSRVDLARSRIGMAVRAGAPRPDIGSVAAFRQALLDAPSIAYSDSASGVYLSRELFARLGVAGQVAGKSRMIAGDPVGGAVAAGEAAVGFQQISELLAVPGIDLVGPIPDALQQVTVYAAGVAAASTRPGLAKALIACLAAPEAAGAVERTGMDPIGAGPPG